MKNYISHKNTAHKTLIIFLTIFLSSCGGGGSNTDNNANNNQTKTTLTITPYLGQFQQGATVRVRKISGELISSGQVNESGRAIIEVPTSTTLPFMVEAGVNGDMYFDERLNTTVSITLPNETDVALRALVPVIKTNIGVTALTEIAVGLIETNRYGGIFATSVNEVMAANGTVFGIFPYYDYGTDYSGDDYSLLNPILEPPALLNADLHLDTTAPDKNKRYTELLSAFFKLAADDKSPLDLVYDLRDDIKDGALDLHIGTTPVITINRIWNIVEASAFTGATLVQNWNADFVQTSIANAETYATQKSGIVYSGCNGRIFCQPDSIYQSAYLTAIPTYIYHKIAYERYIARINYNPTEVILASNEDWRVRGNFYGGSRTGQMPGSHGAAQFNAQFVSFMMDMYSDILYAKDLFRYSALRRLEVYLYEKQGVIRFDSNSAEWITVDGKLTSYINSNWWRDIQTTWINNLTSVDLTDRSYGTFCRYYDNTLSGPSNGYRDHHLNCVSGLAPVNDTGSGNVNTDYLCPTTKPPFDPNWIQSHGSYWAAASAHDAGNYALEQQYCDYAYPACLAVATNASDCPG